MAVCSENPHRLGARGVRFTDTPRIVTIALDPATMRLVRVVGAAEALLGDPAEDWLAPGFWSARLHPDDREAVLQFAMPRLAAGTSFEFECRMQARDGAACWVRHAFGADPAPYGMALGVLTGLDTPPEDGPVTLESAAVRDALLGLVAGELSQPLNEVSSFAAMLERHLSARRDDVGSDIAVGLRDGIEAMEQVLARHRDAAHENGAEIRRMVDRVLIRAGGQTAMSLGSTDQ